MKIQRSGAVERESGNVPLEKATVVNPGEILGWTIMSENSGNGAALEYKTVGHIPRGTTFVANSAKADGNAKTVYSIVTRVILHRPDQTLKSLRSWK